MHGSIPVVEVRHHSLAIEDNDSHNVVSGGSVSLERTSGRESCSNILATLAPFPKIANNAVSLFQHSKDNNKVRRYGASKLVDDRQQKKRAQ